MKNFILIMLLFYAPIAAADQSFFEYLKSLGKSDCEAFLDNGDALISASNKAANIDDWEAAFYYDDQAFHTYLKAFGHCEDDKNKKKVRTRLDNAKLHNDQLACIYHLERIDSLYRRATLAVEHLKSSSVALEYATQSLEVLETDGRKFCSYNEDRKQHIHKLHTHIVKTVQQLQAYVDEHGDDNPINKPQE